MPNREHNTTKCKAMGRGIESTCLRKNRWTKKNILLQKLIPYQYKTPKKVINNSTKIAKSKPSQQRNQKHKFTLPYFTLKQTEEHGSKSKQIFTTFQAHCKRAKRQLHLPKELVLQY